ncbi:DUF2809 domain-containing protein [Daejeonella sp.]|uniref:ribosomal maturation YjgA family protein n=1 Tax=Daejeonella sp. TaxID=2805397 RepID=UPI0030BC3328
MPLKVNSKYMEYAIVLFLTEVFIALYITDAFVRPYVGDFLVVILLYCIVKSVVEANKTTIALSVLLFAYLLETLQYFRIVEVLGLESYPLANVIIGTSFAWIDMLAYTLGSITVLIVERRFTG